MRPRSVRRLPDDPPILFFVILVCFVEKTFEVIGKPTRPGGGRGLRAEVGDQCPGNKRIGNFSPRISAKPCVFLPMVIPSSFITQKHTPLEWSLSTQT